VFIVVTALTLYRIGHVVMAFKTAYHTTAIGAVWRTLAVSGAYLVVILVVLGTIALGLIRLRLH
jgi:hypothetical protein